MKLHFSKTFFVPLAVIFSILSLTSCGKDYDLVSEYVVREAPNTLEVRNVLAKSSVNVEATNNATFKVKKK